MSWKDTSSDVVPDLQHDLDRLADGELSDPERRQLLLRLEGEPRGLAALRPGLPRSPGMETGIRLWRGRSGRRRAGAEGRIRESCRGRRGSEHPPAAPAMADRARHGPGHGGMLFWWLSGSVGGCGRSPWHPSRQGPQRLASARRWRKVVRAGVPSGRAADSGVPEQLLVSEPGDASAPWQTVTLSLPDAQGGGQRRIRLPAIPRDRLDVNWREVAPFRLVLRSVGSLAANRLQRLAIAGVVAAAHAGRPAAGRARGPGRGPFCRQAGLPVDYWGDGRVACRHAA